MERLRVSEQKWARVRRAVHGGGRRVPPDTPCSSRPPPCTWSTAAAAEPAQRGTRRFRTQSRRALHCHTRARLRRPRAWRRRQSFWASQGLAPPPAPQAEAKGFQVMWHQHQVQPPAPSDHVTHFRHGAIFFQNASGRVLPAATLPRAAGLLKEYQHPTHSLHSWVSGVTTADNASSPRPCHAVGLVARIARGLEELLPESSSCCRTRATLPDLGLAPVRWDSTEGHASPLSFSPWRHARTSTPM